MTERDEKDAEGDCSDQDAQESVDAGCSGCPLGLVQNIKFTHPSAASNLQHGKTRNPGR